METIVAGEWWAWFSIALGLLAIVAGLAAAIVLLWKAPRRPVNRLLAAIVFLDAMLAAGLVGILNAEAYSTDFKPGNAASAFLLGMFGAGFLFAVGSLPPLILLFLSRALSTPLVRPFRTRVGRIALWIFVALGLVAAPWSFRGTGQVAPYPFPDFEAQLFLLGLVSLYALAASATALITAPPGSLMRTQARAFLMAFGLRDALWLVVLLGTQWALLYRSDRPGWDDALSLSAPVYTLLPVATLAFLGLLMAGVLRTQMLGIELHLHRTFARGAVGVSVLLVASLAAGLSERWLEQYNVVAGGLAAGLMLLFLHPLQRLGERLATVAVPGARRIEDLDQDARRKLYVDQLHIAWEDGRLGVKERRLLETTRATLGISVDEAHRLELTVMGTVNPRPSKKGQAPPARAGGTTR